MDPLRVGVLLDSRVVPAWVYSVLEEISTMPECELAMVVGSGRQQSSSGWRSRRQSRAFAAYERLDRRLFRRKLQADPFDERDTSALLKNVPALELNSIPGGMVARFAQEDVQRVADAALDVLLYFGAREPRGAILGVARYGVWFHDMGKTGPAPPLYREIHEGNPVSESTLRRLHEEGAPDTILYRSYAATHPYSLCLNRAAVYWKTARFAARRLRGLYAQRPGAVTAPVAQTPIHITGLYALPTSTAHPNAWQLLGYLLRIAIRFCRLQLENRMSYGQWYLAVARRRAGIGPVPEHGTFLAIESPAASFYADPCLVPAGAREYLFFEDYSFAARKGRISFTTLTDPGDASPVQTALEEPFHLSYPVIFEHLGCVYMIPETQATSTVRLYRADTFPHDWRLDTVLIDEISGTDATWHFDGRYHWIFVAVAEPGMAPSDELCLYFAENLRGPYRPHPMNPVVSDVRFARPAGKLLEHDGALYRPSQDCSIAYGRAISLNAIETLNPSAYRERFVERISAEWLPESERTHTLSLSSRWVATDGLRRTGKFRQRFKQYPTGVVPILAPDPARQFERSRVESQLTCRDGGQAQNHGLVEESTSPARPDRF